MRAAPGACLINEIMRHPKGTTAISCWPLTHMQGVRTCHEHREEQKKCSPPRPDALCRHQAEGTKTSSRLASSNCTRVTEANPRSLRQPKGQRHNMFGRFLTRYSSWQDVLWIYSCTLGVDCVLRGTSPNSLLPTLAEYVAKYRLRSGQASATGRA